MIQRFEYAYELSFKLLRRYLELASESPSEIDKLWFSDIIRMANEEGLLSGNLEDWDVYRKARNATSHAYDQSVANFVVKVAKKFHGEAVFMLAKLLLR